MQKTTAIALLSALLLACGGDSSVFPGSYMGTASVTLTPTGGSAQAVNAEDVLVNLATLDSTSVPDTDLEIDISSDFDCYVLGVDMGDTAQIPVQFPGCSVLDGAVTVSLDGEAMGTMIRTGDQLTINLTGSYQDGSYTATVFGTFVPGTEP